MACDPPCNQVVNNTKRTNIVLLLDHKKLKLKISPVYTETKNYSSGRIIRLNYSSDSVNTVDELIGIEITYQLIRPTKYGNMTIFLDAIVNQSKTLPIHVTIRRMNCRRNVMIIQLSEFF